MQAAQHGLDHIVDQHRLKARVGLRQRKDPGDRRRAAPRSDSGTNRRGRTSPTAGRWSSPAPRWSRGSAVPPRPWSAGSSSARRRAAFRADTCRSRVTPAERAACSTPRVSSVCARLKPAPPKPRSLRMPTRLITTSLPRKRSLSCASAIHIAVFQGQAGQHQQVLVLLPVARQNGDPVAVLDQARDQPGAQESGAAENDYGLRAHRFSELESVARRSRAAR